MEKSEKKTTTVAIVNNTPIVVIENGEKRVAVKPICQALGINYPTQLEKLKNDPILGKSVVPLRGITGADGKRYEMVTIPFKYVFGWLFRIDSRNVKPEVRKNVLRYQMECYDALYEHFTELDEYLRYRTHLAEDVWTKVEQAREDFKFTKNKLESLKKEFLAVRSLSFEDWKQQKRQLAFEFPAENQPVIAGE